MVLNLQTILKHRELNTELEHSYGHRLMLKWRGPINPSKGIRNSSIGRTSVAARVEFLLTNCTTPHSTTKVPPCELLLNRTAHGKLPALLKKKVKDRHKEARVREIASQEYQKAYADKRRNLNHRTFDSEIWYLLSKNSKIYLRADLVMHRTKSLSAKINESQPGMVDILLLVMHHFSNRLQTQILQKMSIATVTRI